MLKQFGKGPDKFRRQLFEALDNYKEQQFQNLVPTPAMAEGMTMGKALFSMLRSFKDTVPAGRLPSVKTDMKHLPKDGNVLIWFGHSSYFIQLEGVRMLVDPVFSGSASPIPGSIKAFAGSNVYQAEDLPDMDVLLISHDHWDHLDFKTIHKLRGRTRQVICGLGVAQHFESWGWEKSVIKEKNWFESVEISDEFRITLTPARHFSGRTLRRNISLWVSFVVKTSKRNLFLGGDSGYGPHFKGIGDEFGPFDLALLECGQYNEKWPYIHTLPSEITGEVRELRAKNFMPVHHSKFKLAQHPWNEPLEQASAFAEQERLPITTPRIGEKVNLDDLGKSWDKWWRQL